MYQGRLDGLCGIYSIVNALELLEYGNPDDVFRVACSALANSRWPDVLWHGTSLRDLERMIKACKELADTNYIDVRYPFRRAIPKTNDEYWERFDELFRDDQVVCAIVGIKKPYDHWIVAGRDGGRIQFWDADPYKPEFRKNRKSLYAGERRRLPDQWLLDREALIIFSRVD